MQVADWSRLQRRRLTRRIIRGAGKSPTARQVLVNPVAGAAPLTIWALGRLQPAPHGGNTQSVGTRLSRCKGLQGDQTSRSSHRWHDKAMKVVQNRPGQKLAERTGLADVGATQSLKVLTPLALEDDHRRIAQPDQQQVHQQPTRTAVAIQEWMDLMLSEAAGLFGWSGPNT